MRAWVVTFNKPVTHRVVVCASASTTAVELAAGALRRAGVEPQGNAERVAAFTVDELYPRQAALLDGEVVDL